VVLGGMDHGHRRLVRLRGEPRDAHQRAPNGDLAAAGDLVHGTDRRHAPPGPQRQDQRKTERAAVRHLWEAKTRIEQQADYPVELAIVDSKAINVFAFRHEDRAMIGFTRAFVKQFGDNADIIGVTMGHEIAHHTLGHTRGSRGDREAAMQIAASVLGTIANQFVPFSGNAVGLAVTSVGRSFSRNEERDADATGFTLAHRAGFDICEGATLWQQLHEGNTDDLLQTLMSTHPGGEERLENLQALAVALRGRGC